MKPRLIFTVTNDLNYDQRMMRICGTMTNAGYDVLLIGRQRSNSQALQVQNFEQKRLHCFFDRGKLFYIEYNLRLLILLSWMRFDLVCAIDLDTLLPAFIVARLRRKILVYDAHEYFSQVPELVNRPRTQRIWQCLEQWIIPQLSHCYTVGEGLAKVFKKKFGTPFQVVRNVPWAIQESSTNSTNEQPTTNPKILLYQGVLNDGRGLEQMIRTMTKIEGASLWLAGEGDLSATLRQLVHELKLEDKVRFLGYLRPTALKAITAKAYIGLNLLENKGLNYYYSLANKTFDYIQQEIPALHMRFPEYQSINAAYEIGVLVDDLKEVTLHSAVRRLLEDETYYQQLKANCRRAKKVYTWERESEKLTAFYAQICPLPTKEKQANSNDSAH
ncbi:MAG: glycosyltransferase [Bacteroidota bacterium]